MSQARERCGNLDWDERNSHRNVECVRKDETAHY